MYLLLVLPFYLLEDPLYIFVCSHLYSVSKIRQYQVKVTYRRGHVSNKQFMVCNKASIVTGNAPCFAYHKITYYLQHSTIVCSI